MKKYEILDDITADIGFIVYGKSLNELFENAAIAMFEVMIDINSVEKSIEKIIEIESDSLESLMYKWLNELLYFVDSENLAFSEFKVDLNEEKLSLKAKCKGEKIDRNKHKIGTLVKACTYHQLKIWKENVWKAKIILDI
ncbi:MAG: archease [Candidatus Aenigmatarchaeota archaeon]